MPHGDFETRYRYVSIGEMAAIAAPNRRLWQGISYRRGAKGSHFWPSQYTQLSLGCQYHQRWRKY